MQADVDATLHPRMALPLTDYEIRELYCRAQGFDLAREAIESQERVEALTWLETTIYMALAFVLGLALAVQVLGAGSAANVAYGALLAIASVMSFLVGALVRRLAHWGVIGPFSWLAASVRKRQLNLSGINPLDTGVLAVVVTHLTRKPLEYAEQLQTSVEESRAAIARSLAELPKIVQALNEEIAASREAAMTLLLDSKRSAAEHCMGRLAELDAELRSQYQGAEEAVQPVRELAERFGRLRRLSESLASIQAAHGLIEKSEEAVEDGRMQLRLVQAASDGALARLHEIEKVVDAHERARAEVGL